MSEAHSRSTALVGIGLAAFLLLAFYLTGRATTPSAESLSSDALKYLQMAGWSGAGANIELPSINYPFVCRVLTPWLVEALPLDPAAGFQLITLTCLAIFILLLQRILRLLEFPPSLSIIGASLGLTLFYPTLYYTRNPFMVDPLFLVLWAVAVISIMRRAAWWLASVMVIGVINKEAMLLAALAWAIVWYDPKDKARSIFVAGLIATPAAVVYAWLLPTCGFTVAELIGGTTSQLWRLASPGMKSWNGWRFASDLLLAGGPLWLYLPVAWRRSPAIQQRLVLAGAISVLPLLLVASDSGRMLAKAVPFWLPMVMVGWSQLSRMPYYVVAPAVVSGNLLLASSAPLQLSVYGEVGMRAAGVALCSAPALWIAWVQQSGRRQAAAKV